MENFLNGLGQYLGEVGTIVKGTVVVVAVILLLGILNRLLLKQTSRSPGSTFRNQLIMFGASFIGLLLVILALPIEQSTRGQLLNLVGIILSAGIALSSSTFLSNAMAGIMLKSVNNFRMGDFIKTDDVFGRVTERGLFHTEIQTPDRDLTTLPNLFLANNAVTVIRQSGTILSATVSLGYDTHHSKVEKLLLNAATEIGLQDPFVQVLELGDYSIVYRVAGLLTETKKMIAFRSRLRTTMLDSLHEGGVEILSPMYNTARMLDGNQTVIPGPIWKKTAPAADAAPVEVAFDKAEEAEGLNEMQKELATLEESLKEDQKQVKGAEDLEKGKLTTRIEQTSAKIETLKVEIAEAKEREKREED